MDPQERGGEEELREVEGGGNHNQHISYEERIYFQ